MFDTTAAQTLMQTILSNLSLLIFVTITAVLGILGALIGIGFGIHALIKYIAKGGAKEMGLPSFRAGWEMENYNREFHDFRDRNDSYNDMITSREKSGRFNNDDIYRLKKENVDDFTG
jgi:hypothetical protein